MEIMIEISQLTKTFGRFRALDQINLSIYQGQAISLLGPNGSGKTTLIKSILGLVIPESGTISINGQILKKDKDYRSLIGYMPQIGRYPDNMTIEQVISMLKEIRQDKTMYDEELYFGFELNKMLNKKMHTLSGGTRQKVSASLAFLFSPDIYILDEPTAGLDPVANEILKNKISKECAKGKLTLITSHVLSDLEDITSHIIYMQDGKVRFYNTVEILRELTGENKLNKVIASFIQNKTPIQC